ncbi:hypothetical protein VitviT2T_029801 [Vitis vinifera]|uniref:Uncharacterized protein n=2 Tax=Vitis vinifera TaxID=29760 RepID=A0ABY9E0Q4_VITVI
MPKSLPHHQYHFSHYFPLKLPLSTIYVSRPGRFQKLANKLNILLLPPLLLFLALDMEEHMDSMSKALSSQARTNESPEESGWTMYFEDFLANKEHSSSPSAGNYGRASYGYGSSSLVSDAASSAGKKLVDNDHVAVLSLEKRCKKLSFKKRKTKGAVVDDALEDTASSPVTSPKVFDLRQLDMNPKEKAIDISKEKGSSYRQTNERGDEVGFIGRDSDCTELKKRGLCLVPLSMIVDYLG